MVFTAVSWITPGTALPPNTLTPLIGVYGVSFILVFAAILLATFTKRSSTAGLLLLGLLATAVALNEHGEKSKGQAIRVAAIQGDLLGFDRYLEMSLSIEGPVNAIVWPEYALDFDLRESPKKLSRLRQMMAEKNADVLVVGSMTKHSDGSWSNTAIIVGRDQILGSHNKNRPVHFFNDGVAGTDAPAWTTPIGKISTTICFDNDYASVPRKAVANGAELLLIPSMDAEHWTARQHLQHAELFRHRAAENGRWLVVAASSGLTQAIDPRGNRVDFLPLFDPGGLITGAVTQSGLTVHTRFGWLIGPSCTILTGVLAICSILRLRREKRKSNSISPNPSDHVA